MQLMAYELNLSFNVIPYTVIRKSDSVVLTLKDPVLLQPLDGLYLHDVQLKYRILRCWTGHPVYIKYNWTR